MTTTIQLLETFSRQIETIEDMIARDMVYQADKTDIKAYVRDIEFSEDLAQAEEKHIPDFGDVVAALAKRHGLKTEIKDNVLVGSEGKTNQAVDAGLVERKGDQLRPVSPEKAAEILGTTPAELLALERLFFYG